MHLRPREDIARGANSVARKRSKSGSPREQWHLLPSHIDREWNVYECPGRDSGVVLPSTGTHSCVDAIVRLLSPVSLRYSLFFTTSRGSRAGSRSLAACLLPVSSVSRSSNLSAAARRSYTPARRGSPRTACNQFNIAFSRSLELPACNRVKMSNDLLIYG